MLPKEDRYFMTKPELLDKIAGLLGGRVAEEVVLGEVSTGAHNDFQRATGIARSMVTEYGMSDKLGPMQFGQSQGGQVFLGRDFNSEQNYSESIAYEIDQEMQRIIKEQYSRTKQILTDNRDLLDLIATTLLDVETLDAEQINHLKDHGVLPERSYEDNGAAEEQTPAETDDKAVTSDVTGAPLDPSTSDLPNERQSESSPLPSIDEERQPGDKTLPPIDEERRD